MSQHDDRSKARFFFFGARRRVLDPPPFSDLLSTFPAERVALPDMRRPPSPRRQGSAPPTAEAEPAVFSDARAMLAQAEHAVGQSLEYAGSLQADLEHLDSLVGQIIADYKRISATCQEADAKTSAVAGEAGALEQRLNALHEIGCAADEGRASVELLADEVTRAGTSFEQQRRAIETGVAQAVHLSEQLAELERRASSDTGLLEQRIAETAARSRKKGAVKTAALAEVTAIEVRLTQLAQRLDTLQGRVAQLESKKTNVFSNWVPSDWLPSIKRRLLNPASAPVRLLHPWPLVTGSAAALVLALGAVPFMQQQEPSFAVEQGVSAGQPLMAAVFPLPAALPTTGTTQLDSIPVPEPPAKSVDRPVKAKPAPIVVPAPSKAAGEPSVFVGSLNIASTPEGADVFVNQEYVGRTPLNLANVRAGSKVVRIERDGYQRWTASIRVEAKKREQVTAKLEPVAAQ